MSVASLHKQVGRDGVGRFRKGGSGNPAGRKAGSRNGAMLLAEALIEAEALARSFVKRGVAGNGAALKIPFDRLVPRRERPVRVAIPAMGGEISSADAGEVAQMVETMLRAFQTAEFGRRLGEIEDILASWS